MSYNGVEIAAFGPGERADAEPTLVYLGRLKRYKRIEDLLAVLEAHPGARRSTSSGDGDHRAALEAEIVRAA